ncbi:DUF5753 domain-containing protein [Streptomyces gobiensis]|uniref:DUF5753 domain-containing protein n=1 Tax=Streptomyces gobiensis TaxID=2875706 RepID=UPI001E28F36A|nr:DUF5753 domain-containing protein [Streptomyces gobiensis]UGY94497.1 DUF5753 domain-containing protein [Streptomyces gobiensis]
MAPLNRNPTVRHRRLARTLRHLREAAEVTAVAAADHLDCSESKISRIENAQIGIKKGDLLLLLDLYKVDSERTRSELVALAKESSRRGWWDRHRGSLSPLYADYIALEADASEVYNIETTLIPGLLQTEDYARAVVQAQQPNSPTSVVDMLAQVRMRRQEVLDGPNALQLWAIVTESVLRHNIGSRKVMCGQLEHLLAMAERTNLSIQVLPDESFAHAALATSFVILSFPGQVESDVAYADTLLSTVYVEDPPEVAEYSNVFRHVMSAALPLPESVALIEHALNEKRR